MTNLTAIRPNDPPWLKNMIGLKDLSEIAGPEHEPRVLAMFKACGHPEIHDDETAWCAACTGDCLVRAGLPTSKPISGNLMARSYIKYGSKLDLSKPLPRGAICIWPRGTPPSGHVNMVLHDDGEYLTCMGGNQGNGRGGGVTVSKERKSHLLAAVWPPSVPVPLPKAKPATDEEPAVHEAPPPLPHPASGPPAFEVKAWQQRLKDLGYTEVGIPNGDMGTRTTGAIAAFQKHEGLPVTGEMDEATKTRLAVAGPREVSHERAEATVKDLREAGSETVKQADRGGFWGKILAFLGIAGGAGEVGVGEKVQDAANHVSMLSQLVETVRGMFGTAIRYWWVAAIGFGIFFVYQNRAVILRRLADFRSGIHAGR